MNKKQGYIYVLEMDGWIKIGKTIEPKKRLVLYNSSFPVDKIYYYNISERLYNCNEAEEVLLEYMANRNNIQRSRREWFKETIFEIGHKELLEEISNKIEETSRHYLA